MQNVTVEAQKQRKSRNLRAECNIDLILLGLLSGFEIKFGKSKQTTSAKKVHIGTIQSINNQPITSQQILEDAITFECVMRKYWNEKKMNFGEDLLLTKEKMDNYLLLDEIQHISREKIPLLQSNKQTDSNLILWGNNDNVDMDSIKGSNSLRKRKTKNKEASFNNFISNYLINQGLQFNCQIIARKLTLRTLHLFVWKNYTLPNGRVITSDMLMPVTSILSDYIDNIQTTSKSVINRNTLFSMGITNSLLEQCGLDYFVENQSIDSQIVNASSQSISRGNSPFSIFDWKLSSSPSLSVFVPSLPSTYSVIDNSYDSFSSYY